MLITNRKAWWFGFLFLFVSLIIHDRNLYPELNILLSLALSSLRLFLIGAPLLLGLKFIHTPSGYFKALLLFVWLFFLPYTIYSALEIRHVSELCRLTGNIFYTQQCVNEMWKLLPILIYAMAGIFIFVFSLSTVSAHIFSNSRYKRLFIIGVCFYTAGATAFGLLTRFNMWVIFLDPINFVQQVVLIATSSSFWYNTVALGIFFTALMFIMNRIFKHGSLFLK